MSSSLSTSPRARRASKSAKKWQSATPSSIIASRVWATSAGDLTDLKSVLGLTDSMTGTVPLSDCSVLAATLAGSTSRLSDSRAMSSAAFSYGATEMPAAASASRAGSVRRESSTYSVAFEVPMSRCARKTGL